MRDIRSTITQNVLMSLYRHDVGQDTLDETRAVLETQLDKYELSPALCHCLLLLLYRLGYSHYKKRQLPSKN